MFVAVSSQCFPNLSLDEAIDKFVDLEYTSIEIEISENSLHLKPELVTSDLTAAIKICQNTRRLNVCAFDVDLVTASDVHMQQFEACCNLAKATKVVTVSVPSGEIGTPFNEEVERLRAQVGVAESHGVRVCIKNQVGRLSEDPDTVKVLCDNVPGLGLSLDPSHFLCGEYSNRDYDKLIPYVYNVNLRDSKKDQIQVQIGQGEIEYGRLINLLRKERYDRALTVNFGPFDDPEIDHFAELRKMRLLLESLLL